ncbi:hypothetical protein NRB16_01840 [Pseudomonas sp. LJDD11]|uniref:hypothetical protein n=1 Tax=Pseudomonas sp. LJDD11 TaxID=2931984 RepID=UPI00211CB30F|nr:hypothetical protein [Pseudomonas sp. LJDD11]MCQ9422270.1 hypothetical protein [Pseudomonas sp. LJDD11]
MAKLFQLTADIRPKTLKRTNQNFVTQQVLTEIGKKHGVLNTQVLQQKQLGKSFAMFDVKSITPVELGLVSKNLYALGLIDKVTANLMLTAGTSLDAYGNQTAPDVKINALDYFAARIDSLKKAGKQGNDYAFHVVPDYIATVHALLNLEDFARQQPGAASEPPKRKSSSRGWNGFSAKA